MDYRIILPASPSKVERNAAEELQTWLSRAYSDTFSIASEPEQGTFYVGYTAFADAAGIRAPEGQNDLKGVEAWVVRAANGALVLTGGRKSTDRGILYAVEHYLEDAVGVRFWNALEETVPQHGAFSLDGTLDLCGEPQAVMRLPVTCSYIGDDVRFCVRRRSNQLQIPDEWGGGVTCSPRGGCHTVDQILKSDGLFEQHPTWFAWSEKEQRHLPYGQYCLNNEEFLQAFEKAFLDDIARIYADFDARGESRPHHFHLSMNDSTFDCECPACRERVRKSGGTGNVLRFVNRMARAAAKVYPDILVETLVYLTYMELPMDDTVPEKNVIVRLADLDFDILHGFDHPNNAHMLEILEGWSRLCAANGNPLCVWDYNINVRISTIVANAYRLGNLFRTYAKNNVQGYFVEHEEPLLSDFWCLKNWLLSHLAEDPCADTGALTRDFMDGYYGAASPMLTRYLELTCGAAAKSPLRMRCVENFSKADFVPYELIIEGNRLFEEAAAAVSYDGVLSRRVRQARASLDVTILIRYDSLLYAARQRGETFPIARETAALRYALTVNETILQTEPYRMQHGITAHPYWEGLVPLLFHLGPHKPHPLPDCFAGRDDVLEVPLYDYVTQEARGLGIVYSPDEQSVTGFSARCQLDRMPDYVRDQHIARHAGEPGGTLAFRLRHNGANFEKPISIEDLTPNEYRLYRVFDIDGLTEGSNTLLTLTRYLIAPHISGFAKIFPHENVTVWVSMKATGAAFGGRPGDVDALWFDRMFLEARD